ncbi:MAG: hypothetical protein ACLSG5_16910 [Oscillospiraceae bacterium]
MKKGLPRTDSSGRGVISAVCIRRKLRTLAELGQPILISRSAPVTTCTAASRPGNCDIPAEACWRWLTSARSGRCFPPGECTHRELRARSRFSQR